MPPSIRPRGHALLFGLTGAQQGAVFALHGRRVELGRDPDLQISLDDAAVSSRHASLVHRPDGTYLVDNGSRSGTFVNERRIEAPRRLEDGDHVRFGNTILRFSLVDELEERALTKLYDLTVRDPLTSAYNRRFLMAHLRSELAFAARHGMSLALLLVDIDRFKLVNDSYGHHVGDVVLQLVANAIQRLLRPYDSLCRYGGEEFVVVARDTSLRNGEILAQRIRRQIEHLHFDVEGRLGSLTVSVGVAAVEPATGPDDDHALLCAADRALYAAKEAGRNTVRTHAVPAAKRSELQAFGTTPPAAPLRVHAHDVENAEPSSSRSA